MQRFLVVLAIVGACSKTKEKSWDKEHGGDKKPKEAEVAPPQKIDGPSVTPIKSESVAFVVPKDAQWWGEMNFSCYRAVMSLSGTKTAGEAFEKLSPNVPGAMAAGGIDLGRDMAAIGAFDCGGTPCLYVVGTLAQPDKMGEVLQKLVPGIPHKMVVPGHYTMETQGMRGVRTIHVRVIPLQWTAKPTGDAWLAEAGRATHAVFIGGVDGKNLDVDPVTKLADPATALAHVKDAEGVLGDARGRCILGRVGANDFQPGYKLERARFALAAPSGKSDPVTEMLQSNRTVELVVELVLAPAPKEADVKKWIEQGRAWASQIAAPVKMQFAGNPMLDALLEMFALLGERGFKYELKDTSLKFSWRTDRVPRSELTALEKRFEALVAQ